MTDTRVKPDDCKTMTQVRHGVDRIDEEILELLAERFGYMRAAARIKPDRGAVRDERRKTEVIGHATRMAREQGIPTSVVADMYERLVEGSIAYELERFDRTRN